MSKLVGLIFLAITLLAGCEGEPATKSAALNLTDVLSGDTVQGFKRAYDIRQFQFPDDHGQHPGYRNEWWYLTGNLTTEGDRHFGYQVTFFRTSLFPDRETISSPGLVSKWSIRDIWMAHAAVTDIAAQRHDTDQRFSRANPGLAGARIDPLRIWLDDWQIAGQGNDFPWRVTVRTEEFSLQLDLTVMKQPVLQGNQGLSQKSAEPGNASYYYSYTRLATSGRLKVGDRAYEVAGNSWFDREWSTSSLDSNQSGWDWFSLQFDTGEDLMYYQLRDLAGQPDGNSQGSWIDREGRKTPIAEPEMRLTVLGTWQSENGQAYPVRWRMDYLTRDQSWIIQASAEDQLMDLAVRYWEGAVEIYHPTSMELLGRGYLEMTRIK